MRDSIINVRYANVMILMAISPTIAIEADPRVKSCKRARLSSRAFR